MGRKLSMEGLTNIVRHYRQEFEGAVRYVSGSTISVGMSHLLSTASVRYKQVLMVAMVVHNEVAAGSVGVPTDR